MNKLMKAFCMSLGMFTALPAANVEWDEELRRHTTVCLPFVGLVVGLMWWGAAALAKWLLPQYLAAALIAVFPFAVTGFIHLDGYMDTSDAMLSWRSREERIAILKDVHTGSFAVVMLGILFLFQFAACMSVERLFPLALIPVLSRIGSAVSVLCLEPLGHSEYAQGGERTAALVREVKRIALIAAAVVLVLMLLFSGWQGLLSGLAVLGGYALAMRWCVRTLGGVSGDLAGFALTLSELCGLVILAIF